MQFLKSLRCMQGSRTSPVDLARSLQILPDPSLAEWTRMPWGALAKPEDRCAEGPAYWCRNPVTALQCRALEHCLQEGWSPAASEDTCADCKQVVTILIRMAKESSFKKAIQKYLEDECTSLPLQTLVPRCQTLVDTYYALFIATLEGQMVSQAVGLCPSAPSGNKDTSNPLMPELQRLLWPPEGKALLPPHIRTQGGAAEELPIPLPMCWLCRNFMGKVESLIPKATISKSLAQLCRALPIAATGLCECMVERYSVVLVDMIVEKLGPRLICGMMRMCVAEEDDRQEMPQGGAAPSPVGSCQTCLALSEQTKASLRAMNGTTQAEMEVALLTACANSFLGWQECKSFLRQHQPLLFTLLAKPWSSKTTCQELGACVAEEEPPGVDTACARGPLYWCSSLRAAEQCKAVHHCQAHVWP
ncbi:hypothetical protein JRQ81_011243 [Phrynocephalus forsythii]|uniref:Pulmonary surfactant-associated protein B n=1 Tax=Phrynocephalus forsythii TaxID=171643 RepID=A0A9Q0X9Q6_9SAUR|nr:hypothetical protein JRQ81_011243 [Phrynocephalus forsythii]